MCCTTTSRTGHDYAISRRHHERYSRGLCTRPRLCMRNRRPTAARCARRPGERTIGLRSHTCPARRLLGGGEPDCRPGVWPYCWSVRVVNGSCVFMECGDFLPASVSAESRPPVDNCAYSSSSAGMRPARKKMTGSSSKSPSSASPVRDRAITPTLLCARRSAVRRAVTSDLHATDGSARRRVPRPARNDCTV
jgi:hypothetical protein